MSLNKSKCWYSNNRLHFLSILFYWWRLSEWSPFQVFPSQRNLVTLIANTRPSWRGLLWSNTLAYLVLQSLTRKLTTGPIVIKRFRAIIHRRSLKARVFVLGRPFQALIFAGKVSSLPKSWELERRFTRIGSVFTQKHQIRLEIVPGTNNLAYYKYL